MSFLVAGGIVLAIVIGALGLDRHESRIEARREAEDRPPTRPTIQMALSVAESCRDFDKWSAEFKDAS